MRYHEDMEITPRKSQEITLRTIDNEVASWLLTKRSDNTRKAYARDLGDFSAFANGLGVDILDVTPDHVNAWARKQSADGVAASTVNRRLSTVSSFFAKLVMDGKSETNPADAARVTRENRSPGKQAAALDTAEMRALIKAAANAGDRDSILIQLLAHTGMRVSELCDANVGDVRAEKGHCVLFITGKGNKTRKVAVPSSVCALLDDDGRSNDQPLVTNNEGGRLNRHQVTRILARLQNAAGISTKITPHVLRATMITEALDAGAELWVVQDAAGHADSRTTRAYQRRAAALEKSPTYALAARWA